MKTICLVDYSRTSFSRFLFVFILAISISTYIFINNFYVYPYNILLWHIYIIDIYDKIVLDDIILSIILILNRYNINLWFWIVLVETLDNITALQEPVRFLNCRNVSSCLMIIVVKYLRAQEILLFYVLRNIAIYIGKFVSCNDTSAKESRHALQIMRIRIIKVSNREHMIIRSVIRAHIRAADMTN